MGLTPLYLAALFPWREGAARVVGALLRWGANETNFDGCCGKQLWTGSSKWAGTF